MIRVLLTGGGSGGHIYPLIAVADEVSRLADESNFRVGFSYAGSPGKFKEVLRAEGIPVRLIAGGKIRNYFSILNFLDPFKIFFSFFQALFLLFFLMPDVIFSKGGPGAFPVVFAGWFYRIPVLIHDSDAIPGKTNRASAAYAKWIAVSFEGASKYFKPEKIALVGNPIRMELLRRPTSHETAIAKFGFSPDLPLILILGASQGATRINDFIFDNIETLITNYQILHQVGIANYDEAVRQMNFIIESLPSEQKARYKVVPFFEDDYEAALSAADIVVGRASGGLIFEIAAFGKPSILIPLPESAQDHQKENAYAYAKSGATIVIEQENLFLTIFKEQLSKILGDADLYSKMSAAALAFTKPKAAAIIADEIIKFARKK